MRKFAVLTALALSCITASCAERMVHPTIIPQPTPPKAASKPIPNNVEMRRRTETIAENTGKHLAIRARQVTRSVSVKPEQSPEPQALLPQVSQQTKETPTSREPPAVVASPPPPESAEPSFPVAALMPPPPEPAQPIFPSTPRPIEPLPPPEPPISTLPEVSLEAVMPQPPNPAEPSFPVAALIPAPSDPAEPSLPSQEQMAAGSSTPIPFPELPSYLSLSPRFDWVDTVGSIEVPRGPVPETSEASPEKLVPSLIQSPWPLPMDST